MTSRPLKVFPLDSMSNAPFVVAQYRERLPCTIVTNRDEADLLVARRMSEFASGVPAGRRYLLWTHEPSYDVSLTTHVENFMPEALPGASIEVFNVHNGAVYTDNFYVAPISRKIPHVRDTSECNVPFADKTIVFAATYRLREVWGGGQDLSLNRKRCELASDLHAMGACRIIGNAWPSGLAEGESRRVDRVNTKMEFFKQANFALCLENTCASYYVTGKLWEGIHAGCLPIYWSNDTIYQLFPRNSFIDVRDFPTSAALHEFVVSMPAEEYVRRLNLCRRAYNTVVTEQYRLASRERTLQRLIARLESYLAGG